MWNEVSYAVRIMRRFKLYSIAVVCTLAIGIGSTTAVFSVIDATLLRPLPYHDPERLVALATRQTDLNGDTQTFPLSQIELITWRASATLEAVEALEARSVAMTGSGEPEVIDSGAVTSGFFRVLGASPAIGRTFTEDEERQGAGVVVLSDAIWRNRFNADPSVLGRTLVLGGRSHAVIGVMRRDFRLLFDGSTVWTPLNPVIDPARQNVRIMTAVGRLRAGVTPAQSQAELVGLARPLATQFPIANARTSPLVTPLAESLFGPRAPALWLLGIAVTGLLALACANVGNLTLNHLSLRQAELATRSLLGASGARIARMLLLQTGILAGIGGSIGLVAVALALGPLVALYNGGGTGVVALDFDWRVIVMSAAVIVGTTLLCAGVPGLKIHRASARGEGLRMAAVRFGAGPWERRVRSALVSLQIALAIALLCASGTLVKSLDAVLAVAPGFASDHVLTMQMALPPAIYPDAPARAGFVERMLQSVEQVQGVLSVGTTQSTFLPQQSMFTQLHVEGIHVETPDRSHIRHITPGYFAALRVPILEGRPIDARDRAASPLVCMVSEAFARKYFPGRSALGHRVRRAGATPVWMTIIGVAGDVRDNGLTIDPGPVLYVPYLQLNTATARVSLVARTAGDPTRVAGAIRQAIWQVDRNQPIDRVAPLESILREGASAERFRTWLVAQFAFAGVLLAIVGVYAMTSASVAARTWEASIRLALGARPWTVASGIVRDTSIQVLVGVALGLGSFYLLRSLIASLLFRTSAFDVTVIASAVGVLTLLALSAAAWQARRLTATSPALGLRQPAGGGDQ